jgi:hypothetical protein
LTNKNVLESLADQEEEDQESPKVLIDLDAALNDEPPTKVKEVLEATASSNKDGTPIGVSTSPQGKDLESDEEGFEEEREREEESKYMIQEVFDSLSFAELLKNISQLSPSFTFHGRKLNKERGEKEVES